MAHQTPDLVRNRGLDLLPTELLLEVFHHVQPTSQDSKGRETLELLADDPASSLRVREAARAVLDEGLVFTSTKAIVEYCQSRKNAPPTSMRHLDLALEAKCEEPETLSAIDSLLAMAPRLQSLKINTDLVRAFPEIVAHEPDAEPLQPQLKSLVIYLNASYFNNEHESPYRFCLLKRLASLLSRWAGGITSLTFENVPLVAFEGRYPKTQIFGSFKDNMPRLKSLHFKGCSFDTIYSLECLLFMAGPNLASLRFSMPEAIENNAPADPSYPDDEATYDTLLRTLEKDGSEQRWGSLRELELTQLRDDWAGSTGNPSPFLAFPALERLTIHRSLLSDFHVLEGRHLYSKVPPSLRKLTIILEPETPEPVFFGERNDPMKTLKDLVRSIVSGRFPLLTDVEVLSESTRTIETEKKYPILSKDGSVKTLTLVAAKHPVVDLDVDDPYDSDTSALSDESDVDASSNESDADEDYDDVVQVSIFPGQALYAFDFDLDATW